MAADGGAPARIAYATVVLTVDRNLNTPFWITPGSGVNYQTTTQVLETQSFGSTIYQLSASDQDFAVRPNCIVLIFRHEIQTFIKELHTQIFIQLIPRNSFFVINMEIWNGFWIEMFF